MRKKTQHTITDEGRDKSKVFLLTEMSASKGEAWAMRCLLALAAGNVEMPDDWDSLGMAGLAEIGIKAVSGLKWDVAEPLLAEMMECVQIIPDTRNMQVIRPLIEDDIEEIKTRLSLRMEVWKLHMDFLSAVVPSTLHEALGMAAHHGHATATYQS